MKISTFFYTIGQGFRNLFRNAWYSLASIATISACLFLLGVLYAIVANFQSTVQSVEEGVCVTVFFDEDVTEERVQEIGMLIQGREEVSDIQFISAEEAWEWYQQEYFQDRAEELLKGYPTNPLENYFNYQVYLSDVSRQSDLITYIESLSGVRFVRRDAAVAEILSGVNLLIGYVTMGIIVILLAVSIFLISNTINIGISVRKEEINIMKYIGATDFFVRAPFVIEGILIGGIGAAIPLLVVHQLYETMLVYFNNNFTFLQNLLSLLPVNDIFDFLTPVCLIVGVGIGFLGSFSTVRKHLHV